MIWAPPPLAAVPHPAAGPRPSRGFTLIELMVTLGILAVLATLVVPTAQVVGQRHKEQELRLALREIRDAIDAYKRAVDEGRIARQAGDTGYPPDLDVLVDGVEDRRHPKRTKMYFLRRIPRDPFHADAQASNADIWGLRAYASDAQDPQAGDDVYDVYSRSERVGLNGVPLKAW
ncbi:MAG: general secretion pathway protein GspG [Burkholderiales bacterium RIFCSPLOWO2_12_67_14]|nr:MAG: general secretion pathway protein GspG [Burkholderiales bacterium RIFCSPLOWO2_02_FULL_67_64]OGB39980.1 MAG: general secretion pathway protein GspG [Burkholderiales bacterium RIFCSPHIGHO2_12_FULL_67_38]OGB43960.1 MAG: general secretion pathway protein GspG [Burkholderiales bacterium RIFCSPLOWO2_12_67_14]OGB88748.1 MAG: general secretion pathway protein GspG [Burkholderiales bacterium RIFCSPLOWO2_12_FULL_67_210]